MGLFKNLFGGKPKSKETKKAGSTPAQDSPRAKLIADALRIQRAQGAVVRKTLADAIRDLGKTGPKILRDPDALARLVSLVQARQTLFGIGGGTPPAGGAKQPKGQAGSPGPSKTRPVRH